MYGTFIKYPLNVLYIIFTVIQLFMLMKVSEYVLI